jgi:hypothetical protein
MVANTAIQRAGVVIAELKNRCSQRYGLYLRGF